MNILKYRFYLLAIVFFTFSIQSCRDDEEYVIPALPSNPTGFDIVKDLTETDSIEVFSELRIPLNYKVDNVYDLEREGAGYKIKILSAEVFNGEEIINTSYFLNESKDTLILKPKDNYPPGQLLSAKIKATWQMRVDEVWKNVNDGIEEKQISFYVNPEPEIIGFIGFANKQSSYSIFSAPVVKLNYELDSKSIYGYIPRITDVKILWDKIQELEFDLVALNKNEISFLYADPLPENKEIGLSIQTEWGFWENNVWTTVYRPKRNYYSFLTSQEAPFDIDILPINSDENVSIYATLSAEFDSPIIKIYKNNPLIRAYVKAFNISYDGGIIPAFVDFSNDSSTLLIKSEQPLPENKLIKIDFEIGWQKWDSNGWTTVWTDHNFPYSCEFTTTSKDESDLMPYSDFEYSYPLNFQYNFLRQEYNKGFIKYRSIDPLVVDMIKATSSENRIVRYSNTSESIEENFTFSEESQTIDFAISSNLKNGAVYKLEVMINGLVLSKIHFRTSLFNTFSEKIEALNISSGWRSGVSTLIYILGQTIDHESELFDKYEINDLIKLSAVLDGNEYYENEIYPLIYKGVESGELELKRRTGSKYGIPPSMAVYFRQYPSDRLLNSSEVASLLSEDMAISGCAVVYNLNSFYKSDYDDLRSQIYPLSNENRSDWMNNLMSSPFPKIRKGNYDYKMSYFIPGIGLKSSEVQLSIYNPLD